MVRVQPRKILHHALEACWRFELRLRFIGVFRVDKFRHLPTRALKRFVVGRKLEQQLIYVAWPQGETSIGLIDVAVLVLLSSPQHRINLIVLDIDRDVWFAVTFQIADSTDCLTSNARNAKRAHIEIGLGADAKADKARARRKKVGVLEDEHVRQTFGQPCFDRAGKVQQGVHIAVAMRSTEHEHT